MNKEKNSLSKLILFCITLLFIILSYFKFYTIQVSFRHDPTVAIVKTQDIQLTSNTYLIDEDTLPYNWYDDYGFKFLHADEIGHIWQTIHSSIITLWWIILVCLVFTIIIVTIKKFQIISKV